MVKPKLLFKRFSVARKKKRGQMSKVSTFIILGGTAVIYKYVFKPLIIRKKNEKNHLGVSKHFATS